MPRPPYQPTPAETKQVEALAAYGISEDDIARVIGIAPKTLRKHFRQELDTGHIKANAKVAENLFRKATGTGREAVTAAIFWLKTRARWTEPRGPEPLGKKEAAQGQAQTARQSADWGDLLD
jgi:hypothetical protein